jgi:hypothetical protein
MRIIKQSKDFTVSEMARLTMGNSTKLSNLENQTVDMDSYVVFEDTDRGSGEVKTVLVLMADGVKYGTISPTFIKDFMQLADMYEIAGEPFFRMKVVGGQSKNGRHFIACEAAE